MEREEMKKRCLREIDNEERKMTATTTRKITYRLENGEVIDSLEKKSTGSERVEERIFLEELGVNTCLRGKNSEILKPELRKITLKRGQVISSPYFVVGMYTPDFPEVAEQCILVRAGWAAPHIPELSIDSTRAEAKYVIEELVSIGELPWNPRDGLYSERVFARRLTHSAEYDPKGEIVSFSPTLHDYNFLHIDLSEKIKFHGTMELPK